MFLQNNFYSYLFGVIFIVSVAFAPILAIAQKAYKSTDAQGNVIFSDQPKQGAQQIELKSVETFKAPTVRTTVDLPEPTVFAYENLKIIEPKNEETIWGSQGVLTCKVVVTPEMRATDTLQILLNGEKIDSSKNSTTFNLQGIERGTHSLQAQIVNQAGEILVSSAVITVFLHKTSVIKRQRVTGGR